MEIATATNLAGPWTLKGFVLTSGSSISNAGSKDCWVCAVASGIYYEVSDTINRLQMLHLLTAYTICIILFLLSALRSENTFLVFLLLESQVFGKHTSDKISIRVSQFQDIQIINVNMPNRTVQLA